MKKPWKRIGGMLVPLAVMVLSYSCSNQNGTSNTGSEGNAQITCNLCHGSNLDGSPPTDLSGNTSTSSRGVGAHQSHLLGSDLAAPVACASCHVVPATVSDAGHVDTLPAEVVFGGISTNDSLTPEWNGTTCQNTYCHGAALTGGTNTEPTWTKVDGTEAACGSCHGLPPALPHPQNDECEACHPIANAENHINGTVDVSESIPCNLCHGGTDNAAPPKDVSGHTATTARGVGAHQSHVAASTISDPIACSSCHVVPGTVMAEGHLDASTPADINFDGLATTDGYIVTTVPYWSVSQSDPRNPVWDGTGCADTYCHNPNSGDTNATVHTPTWTLVDGSQIQCDSCHGFPPSGHNPGFTTCSDCHPATVSGPDQTVITGPANHVNGQLNFGQ